MPKTLELKRKEFRITNEHKSSTPRGRLVVGAAAMALISGVTAILTSLPAHTDVDPYGADARFVSIVNKDCAAGLSYHADGHMVDGNGQPVPNSTWRVWDGTVDSDLRKPRSLYPADLRRRGRWTSAKIGNVADSTYS